MYQSSDREFGEAALLVLSWISFAAALLMAVILMAAPTGHAVSAWRPTCGPIFLLAVSGGLLCNFIIGAKIRSPDFDSRRNRLKHGLIYRSLVVALLTACLWWINRLP